MGGLELGVQDLLRVVLLASCTDHAIVVQVVGSLSDAFDDVVVSVLPRNPKTRFSSSSYDGLLVRGRCMPLLNRACKRRLMMWGQSGIEATRNGR